MSRGTPCHLSPYPVKQENRTAPFPLSNPHRLHSVTLDPFETARAPGVQEFLALIQRLESVLSSRFTPASLYTSCAGGVYVRDECAQDRRAHPRPGTRTHARARAGWHQVLCHGVAHDCANHHTTLDQSESAAFPEYPWRSPPVPCPPWLSPHVAAKFTGLARRPHAPGGSSRCSWPGSRARTRSGAAAVPACPSRQTRGPPGHSRLQQRGGRSRTRRMRSLVCKVSRGEGDAQKPRQKGVLI